MRNFRKRPTAFNSATIEVLIGNGKEMPKELRIPKNTRRSNQAPEKGGKALASAEDQAGGILADLIQSQSIPDPEAWLMSERIP